MSDNTPVPFTVLQFLAAGYLLEEEWIQRQCDIDDYIPDYEPCPAFDIVATMAVELEKRGHAPVDFLRAGLNEAGPPPNLENFEGSEFERILRDWKEIEPLEVGLRAYVDSDELLYLPDDFSVNTNYLRLMGGLTAAAEYGEAPFLASHDRVMEEIRDDEEQFARLWLLSTPANRLEIFDFVNGLEKPGIASIAPEDMACPVCLEDFHATTPLIDHKPIKAPCCRQLFGRGCLVEALVCDRTRCPMCRQDIVRIARQQASSSSRALSE